MERKIPSIDFDKEQIDAETRTNLSSDLFDSKQREIDLAIKKQKLIFLSIKNVSLCCGVVLSWITVIWSVCSLNYFLKHYVDLIALYELTRKPLILWMYGLSICSLNALVITLCLTLTRIFVKRKNKVVPKTVVTALLEELQRRGELKIRFVDNQHHNDKPNNIYYSNSSVWIIIK